MSVKKIKSEEYLKYTFNSGELAEIASEMAQAVQSKDRAQSALDATKAQFNSEIKAAERTIEENARKLNNGFEMRQQKIEIMHDFETGTVFFTRLDSGEIFRQRDMSPEERQTEL